MTIQLTDMGYTSVRKCIHIEIREKFNLIHEKEWTVNPYLIFVIGTVRPERLTISGRIGINRKG